MSTVIAAEEATSATQYRVGALDDAACANCGSTRSGPYCHECGQKHVAGRLQIRGLLQEFSARFLRLERGLPRTAWDMTVAPGAMIERFVRGCRRQYVNPFAYVVMGSALALVSYLLIEAQVGEWLRQTTTQSEAYSRLFNPEQYEAFVELTMKSSQYTTYTTLLMCVPFALLMRFLFRKTGRNIAEILVFSLYTFGHVSLVVGLSTVPLYFLTESVFVHLSFTYAMYLVIAGYAAHGFFGRRIAAVPKTWLALGIAYVLVSFIIYFAVFFYVLTFV